MRIIDITDREFRPYGETLSIDTSDILFYLQNKAIMPEEGNIYVRDDASMHDLKGITEIKERVYGYGDIEVGYCNGFNSYLNALEYHSCPEVDIAADDQVLLLALQDDVVDGVVDSDKVKAFRLKKGQAVILYPYVFHFSPCKLSAAGFRTAIILSERTNEELEKEQKKGSLWMKNKWLFAHKESPQAKKGAYIGISGENLLVPYL